MFYLLSAINKIHTHFPVTFYFWEIIGFLFAHTGKSHYCRICKISLDSFKHQKLLFKLQKYSNLQWNCVCCVLYIYLFTFCISHSKGSRKENTTILNMLHALTCNPFASILCNDMHFNRRNDQAVYLNEWNWTFSRGLNLIIWLWIRALLSSTVCLHLIRNISDTFKESACSLLN